MKMVKSLLLGTAAGLVAVAGAQAADLPVKAKPVQYVKICSLYGAGFYYIPGTDTCIKIGGYVRAEVNFNAGGSFGADSKANYDAGGNHQNWRTRAALSADARSQTEYGTLRAYLFIAATDDNSTMSGSGAAGSGFGNSPTGGAWAYNRFYAPAGFIQFAGFTAGKTGSFFDFDGQPYSNQSNVWSSGEGGNGIQLFAYTAQFGNGLSASISAEDNAGRRTAVATGYAVTTGVTNSITYAGPASYGGTEAPDVVGNLRLDQAWGSAQVMAAYHQITTNGTGAPGNDSGYAFGAGLKVNLPMLGKGDYAIGQVTYSKGAMAYVGSGLGTGFAVTKGGTTGVGAVTDAFVVAGNLELTTGWSMTGGIEHNWVPGWKTSLYGSYGELDYSAAVGNANDWSFWQVGSRTVWTPVTNLDLSVEIMYNNLNSANLGAATSDQSWWSGMFRVQRNFYP